MPERVLLTGATGFVGRHLFPALESAGYEVVCATRDVGHASREMPEREWRRFDVEDAQAMAEACRGCKAAFYFVHLLGRKDYPLHERRAAESFARAASQAGIERIVYLGGVAPREHASKHLASRIHTGEVLRRGSVPTLELRAGMIIGHGSASWLIVRDLGERLPMMLLPRWTKNHSWPVSIRDVVAALLSALRIPKSGSAVLDLPGPERISHRMLLERTARLFGRQPPLVDVPVLSPRLSSYWLTLVTRASLALSQELIEGLRHDLDPRNESLWRWLPSYRQQSIEEAMQQALRDEGQSLVPSPESEGAIRAFAAAYSTGGLDTLRAG
mgnify:CR=1 FL=1